jgi:hypothetical protein
MNRRLCMSTTGAAVRAAAVTVAIAVTLGTAGPIASATERTAPVQAAAVVERATGTADLTTPQTGGGNLVADALGARVEIPAHGSGKLRVTGTAGAQVGIGLPGSAKAQAQISAHGTVVYSQPTAPTDVAAQVARDGSVSALITLKNASAPTEYRFPLDLPDGAHAALVEDGGVVIGGGDGEVVGTFSSPWAKDAAGKPVPTSYRLEGNVLVQTIQTDASTAYPVVADPKWWDKTKEIAGGMVSDTWNSMKCSGALAAAFHPGTASYKAIKTAGGVKKLLAALSGVNSKRGAASVLGSGFTTLFGVKSIKKACFDNLK